MYAILSKTFDNHLLKKTPQHNNLETITLKELAWILLITELDALIYTPSVRTVFKEWSTVNAQLMYSTTLVHVYFLRLITWTLQCVTLCVKRLGQSNAMSCFQGSAEWSSSVSLRSQIEALFSSTHWAVLVCAYLFQTNVILSNATCELYVASWKNSVI